MKTKNIILATALVAACVGTINAQTIEAISQQSGMTENEVYEIVNEVLAAKPVAETDMFNS